MPDRWIVISLDALATAAIAPYGSSWNATPHFDRLASHGLTWDRVVVSDDDTANDDAAEVLRQCWMADVGGQSWIESSRQAGRVELFLAGDAGGRKASDRISEIASEIGFDGCTMVELEIGDRPAAEVESTGLAQMVAALVERMQTGGQVAVAGGVDDESQSPWSVLWLHSDLLARLWDAPRWLFPVEEMDDDEEPLDPSDPDNWGTTDATDTEPAAMRGASDAEGDTSGDDDEPTESDGDDDDADSDDGQADEALASNEPPTGCYFPRYDRPDGGPPALVNDTIPPRYRIAAGDHPDWVMTWMQTYGCQVRLVDELVAWVQGLIDQVDPEIGLAIIGTSGMSLGQNGWIGHRAGPINSPQIHVPAILSANGHPPLRWLRLQSLAEASRWMVPSGPRLTPQAWAALSEQAVSGERAMPFGSTEPTEAIDDSARDPIRVETRSDRATKVVTTSQWFYARDLDGGVRLFLKPDDVNDINDVADRCREVIETLEEN